MDNKEYKKFLLQHRLTDAEVGKIFGYANRQSWSGADRRPKLIKGILQIAQGLYSRKDLLLDSQPMKDIGLEFADWLHSNYQPGPNQGTWYDKDFKGNLQKHVPYTTKQIWNKFKKQY